MPNIYLLIYLFIFHLLSAVEIIIIIHNFDTMLIMNKVCFESFFQIFNIVGRSFSEILVNPKIIN